MTTGDLTQRPADVSIMNELCESLRFRLPVKHSDQGGGIKDHFGRPFLS
jgi:hypothetical protein